MSSTTYVEQTVEVALGPKGAFENGNIGTLTRRVPANRVVSAIPLPRANLRHATPSAVPKKHRLV